MALAGALVDRGRELRQQPLPMRVEGSTVVTEISPGEWFKCRLTVEDSNETSGLDGGRPVTVHGMLLYGIKDTGGHPTLMGAGSRVALATTQPNLEGTYELTGRPKPLRKRKRVIGWEVQVARVDEEPFEEPRP